MSGGANKKRSSRTQGWEVAGDEFYQESYPSMEVDLEVLQRDPNHIATLLPSKQSRAATTRRVRSTDTKTLRRRTSTRSRRESTVRRASAPNDVHVAMMPDLSENMPNEQRTWEEIMQIKAMPVPMSQKKEMKSKLQTATHLRLQGLEQLRWRRQKLWQQLKGRVGETYSKLELWKYSLKKIEGNFGTGVVAYFLFIKWLMYLNLSMFLIIFLFLILPTVLTDVVMTTDCTDMSNATECCAEVYFNETIRESELVLDLVQGTGRMEKTVLFYGVYSNRIVSYYSQNTKLYYDLPLAYVCVMLVYFAVSLVAIVKSAARGFKERLTEGEGQFYQYCNLVFGGWDFCIHNEKSATIKHKALYNEIKACLEAEKLEDEKNSRTPEEQTKLIIIRVIVNLVVLVILVAAGVSIYEVFQVSVEQLGQNVRDTSLSLNFVTLFYQFLPSLCIVILNLLLPFIFKYLTTFERYTPLFVVRIMLLRTVFLRLFSLGVLLASLYNSISCSQVSAFACVAEGCDTAMCWETYVGQQIYKLVITDFAVLLLVTFLVNFPRSLIARHSESRFARLIGEQEFELPKHVLDVVYSQTLCWLGCFYAPLLPAIATIMLFLIFYIKKFACLINSKPSATVYRASRSNSLFMFVLLLSYVVATIPVAYSVAEIIPSRACGPFRGLVSVWTNVTTTFHKFPVWLENIILFFSTAGFAVPLFIFLVLCLYYYSAISNANKHMVAVLKNQLVLEGHDKQFLLSRLTDFVKQQQEYQKKIRNIEMMREHNRVTSSSN